MELLLRNRSLVCTFDGLDKSRIRLDPLRRLIKDEAPDMMIVSRQDGPVSLNYDKAGLEVLFLSDRMRVNGPSESFLVGGDGYGEILRQSLDAAGDQRVKAFVLNYEFEIPKDQGIELTSIVTPSAAMQQVRGFTFREIAETALTYTDGDNQLMVRLRSEKTGLRCLVNVHHDNAPISSAELRDQIEGIHTIDFERAKTLLSGLLENGAQ